MERFVVTGEVEVVPEARGTILLTGASGGLGAATIAALQAGGWAVRALVHRRAVGAADETVDGDLGDGGSLGPAAAGCRVVLHMAGVTHARHPAAYVEGNVAGTRRLLDASLSAGVARFVYVSSRTAVAGAGAYGESKLAAEELVRESGIEHVVVRPAEVYGTGGGEGIEEIVARARRGAPILLAGNGTDRVCPLHVNDLAKALAAAASSTAAAGGTYVLGGPCMSLRDFAYEAVAAQRSPSRVVSVPIGVVAAAARASRFLPLPLYPDQLARLRAAKPEPTPIAGRDLGFAARPLRQGLGG